MHPTIVAAGLIFIGVAAYWADEPITAAPGEERPAEEKTHVQMLQEVAALRTARAVAILTQAPPPNATDLAKIRANYEAVIARFPSEAEPHVVFGETLVSLGENEAAFRQWQIALQLDSKRDDILAAEADLLLQTGQIVTAADNLEKAVALAPTNAAYSYSLAHVYTLFRRDLVASRHLTEDELITRGTEYFRRAAELAPENLAYAQAYAETFYTSPSPDWKLARATWETLLARSPAASSDFIRGHLIRVNIRLGNKPEARRHLAALTNPAFAALRASLQKQIDRL